MRPGRRHGSALIETAKKTGVMAFHIHDAKEEDVPLRRFHRQGLGRLLLCHVARRFLDRNVTSMLLFGEATNPSNGFYEAFGAERLYSSAGEFHGGYGWRDLQLLAVKCDGASVRAT